MTISIHVPPLKGATNPYFDYPSFIFLTFENTEVIKSNEISINATPTGRVPLPYVIWQKYLRFVKGNKTLHSEVNIFIVEANT